MAAPDAAGITEMARALIVGCGCRGRELGRSLIERGWLVRGTTRRPEEAGEIEAAGIEPAIADPDAVATVFEQVGDVAVVYWLLGSASGEEEALSAIHGPRLERLLEKLVDTPVRGFVYERAGSVSEGLLDRGEGITRAAGEGWRIPVEVVATSPSDPERWREAMLTAADGLTGQAARSE
jgi:nucleoside-diphosphate-sugar epimerase